MKPFITAMLFLLCLALPAAATPMSTIATWIQACRPSLPDWKAKEYARHIQASCRLHRIDPAIAVALISVESDFNPRERSHVGAVGLTQIMPFQSRLSQWRVSRGGLMRPDINIDRGLYLLSTFRDAEHGNNVRALNRYVGHKTNRPTRYAKLVLRRAGLLRTGRFGRIGQEFSLARGR